MSNTDMMAGTAQAFMESMTPRFAVSYLRVSTRGQAERGGGHDEGFSIPAQREANKNKAKTLGAIVGKEFVDRGTSAKSTDRPQLQAMLEYVKENADRVDYLIVHKVDRLARNRGDDAEIMKILNECGVQLVSTSESIDETPSGMLLHGIMSSIAEFYSQNLATEVRKGMDEKTKQGGTVGRAPLGYKNVRRVDDKGREERTVIVDEERAPLVKLAFEEYASGTWTVKNLTAYLAALGLTTKNTPKMPSRPIPEKTLAKMLQNPYYIGIVTYKGVQYPGAHEPLVDEDTFERIQTILESRLNGERTRKHPHFLKSTIYCAYCGSRMIVTNVTKKNYATVYPYFICIGRHSKKCPDCKSKYVLIADVERKIEQLYENIQLPHEIREAIEIELQDIVRKEKKKFDKEMDGLLGRKRTLEHKSEKLLEAHYNDAIPVDLLKAEQKKLTRELASVENEIKQHNVTFDQISQNLTDALDLLDDCGAFYKAASPTIKKLLNQAIFEKIYISCNREVPLDIEEKYNPPFNVILAPFKKELTEINRSMRASSENAAEKIQAAKDRILKHLKCGLSISDDCTDIGSYQNPNFFNHNSSSKTIMVDTDSILSPSENTSQNPMEMTLDRVSNKAHKEGCYTQLKPCTTTTSNEKAPTDVDANHVFSTTHCVSSNPETTKNFTFNSSSKTIMVEMAGIEPASESISGRVSPSAASALLFRLLNRPKAG